MSITASVRGLDEGQLPPSLRTILHQEVISVSLYKRTLSQYASFGEVARAVADGYKGSSHYLFHALIFFAQYKSLAPAIQWLHNQGFMHRDINSGNLLLARETPSA